MNDIWELVTHTDDFLMDLVKQRVGLAYLIIALIVFLESGVLPFAFLPGDGLLLAVGIVCASSVLNIWWTLILLIAAATLGYVVNYRFGQYIQGQPISRRFIDANRLEQTKKFYARYGNLALIVGRFFPVVRTFAPFLAGIVKMPIRVFYRDTIVGAVVWIGFFVMIGYLFGDIPIFRDNFLLLYIFLVIITVIPFAIRYLTKLWTVMVRRRN